MHNMKKIPPPEEFYGAILDAYFKFIAINTTLDSPAGGKVFVFYMQDNLKGVGHKPFCGQINCNFNYSGKKISEKIFIGIKYEERSKKLSVRFKLKDKDSFKNSLEGIKNASGDLLASFFNELAWGLAEAVFKVEKPHFKNIDCYICPLVKNSPQPRFSNLENIPECTLFCDDILCILFNIYNSRKEIFSFVEISADDIIFLRGIKPRTQERKRVAAAINTLCGLNLIRVKKIKRYKWIFCVLQNHVQGGWLIPKSLICANPSKKYFEKYLGDYICFLISNSHFEFKVKTAVGWLLKKTKYKKLSLLRDKIEHAFDYLVQIGVIENWEYKKIDEEKLKGEFALFKYSKLKIIFRTKKRSVFKFRSA